MKVWFLLWWLWFSNYLKARLLIYVLVASNSKIANDNNDIDNNNDNNDNNYTRNDDNVDDNDDDNFISSRNMHILSNKILNILINQCLITNVDDNKIVNL